MPDNTQTTLVVVRRAIEHLKDNREKHIEEYQESLAGYKEKFQEKLDSVMTQVKELAEKNYSEIKERLDSLQEEDIPNRPNREVLIPSLVVDLEVPRNHVEAYDEAIALLDWDNRETIELTREQFRRYILDKWDWSVGFESVTKLYKGK